MRNTRNTSSCSKAWGGGCVHAQGQAHRHCVSGITENKDQHLSPGIVKELKVDLWGFWMPKAWLGPQDTAACCINGHTSLPPLSQWWAGTRHPGTQASMTTRLSQVTFTGCPRCPLIKQPQRATTRWAVCHMPWPGSGPGP